VSIPRGISAYGWIALLGACIAHGSGSVAILDTDDASSDSDTRTDSDPPSDTQVADTDAVDTESGLDSDGTDSDIADTDAVAEVGLCASYAAAVSTGRVDDPALDEISGLVASRKNPGVLWVLEDSGNEAELYALDEDGQTLATVAVTGATNVDWEDLAVAPCGEDWCLWIGDIGDKGGGRTEFQLYRVEEPTLGDSPNLTVEAVAFPFTYPSTAEDAEGLAILPDGNPLVVTKRANATAGLFTLRAGDSVLTLEGEVATGIPGEDLTARATAADLTPDGQRLLIRTYLYLFEVDVSDLASPARVTNLVPGLEIQGESAGYDPVQRAVWHISEGDRPKIHIARCR
jgi:hypothetical protein